MRRSVRVAVIDRKYIGGSMPIVRAAIDRPTSAHADDLLRVALSPYDIKLVRQFHKIVRHDVE